MNIHGRSMADWYWILVLVLLLLLVLIYITIDEPGCSGAGLHWAFTSASVLSCL